MSMSAVWPIQFLPADKAASGPSPKVRMGKGIFFMIDGKIQEKRL